MSGGAHAGVAADTDRDWVLDDHDWSHKAWMSVTDADLFEAVLLARAAESDRVEVLEWGSGRSTLYFTRLLAERGFRYRWLSLEYDRAFFTREIAPAVDGDAHARLAYVTDASSRNLNLPEPDAGASAVEFVVFDKQKLLPMLRDHKQDRAADLNAYVDLPRRLGRRFDVVLVDGRKRRRCLLEAARILNPRGVALLHDAWRPYYHCAFDAFAAHRRVGDILWIGTQSDDALLDRLTAGAVS